MCHHPSSPLSQHTGVQTLWVLVGDATKVRERVHYVPSVQRAFGLSIPDDELHKFNGGGIPLVRPHEMSSDEVRRALQPYTLATDVYTILGQPLCAGAPSFDLAVWAQGGKKSAAAAGVRGGFSPDAAVHAQRRAMLIHLLRELGVTVCACATDGESASTSASYGTFTEAPCGEHKSGSDMHANPSATLRGCERRFLSAVTFRPAVRSALQQRAYNRWMHAYALCEQQREQLAEYVAGNEQWRASNQSAPPPLPPVHPLAQDKLIGMFP